MEMSFKLMNRKVLRSMIKAASLHRCLPRLAVLLLLTAAPLSAQTFTTLHPFTDGSDGGYPYFGVLSGNTLYGAAGGGGTGNNGTIFSMNTDGTGFTTLYSFSGGSDGGYPNTIILSGNIIYGSAQDGGTSSNGVIFSVNTNGAGFTVLHAFTGVGNDGKYPVGGLILANNTLYGTTLQGGSSGYGTVFSINTDGTGLTILHSFSGLSDGGSPAKGLTLSGNTLYGITGLVGTGTWGYGTVFSINTNSTLFTTLHTFKGGTDGVIPNSTLLLSGSTLYGTAGGGLSTNGVVFSLSTNGTAYTVLYSFTGGSNGGFPNSVLLTGNVLYGTTAMGGSSNNGIIFSMSTNGTNLTTLYSFSGGSDGKYPVGLFLSGTYLFGTTVNGASPGQGAAFSYLLDITNSLADDPNFVAELVSNPYFLSSLSYVITNTPGGYGILQQGSQGIQGPVGPQGLQGTVGPSGSPGAQGPIGLTGSQGATGLTGATGPQGPMGLTGAMGSQGPVGATGPQGSQGPIGTTGPQGATGVFDPTVLTNTDFLNGLAANTNFVSALATNPIFLTALASQLTTTMTNYGIASKAIQTLKFPIIPVQKFATVKKVSLNATSEAKLTPITYSIANPSVGIISNNFLLLQGTGTTTVTASQAGNQYFNPATNTQTLIVK